MARRKVRITHKNPLWSGKIGTATKDRAAFSIGTKIQNGWIYKVWFEDNNSALEFHSDWVEDLGDVQEG